MRLRTSALLVALVALASGVAAQPAPSTGSASSSSSSTGPASSSPSSNVPVVGASSGTLPSATPSVDPSAAVTASDNEARRRALFEEGNRAAVEGRWVDAAANFRQVVALRSAPRALIAQAEAERNLDHLLLAKELLVQAIRDATSRNLVADRLDAERLLSTLAPTIPRVRLARAVGSPKQLTALVDGAKRLIVDDQIEVDPGEHTLTLRALDFNPQYTTVTLQRGEVKRVPVRLSAWNEETAAPVALASGPSFTAPLVVGSGGLVIAGLGFTLMGLGRLSQDEARELCSGDLTGCPLEAQYPAYRGRDEILAGDALVAVGGSALLASVAWTIVLAVKPPVVPVARPTSASVRATERGFSISF